MKMKRVILFWQKVHFNVYRFHLFFSEKIIGYPFDLLLNNKFLVNLYKKRGVENPAFLVRKATTRPDIGPVNWKTDGTMILLISLIVFSFLNIITAIAGYMIWADWSFLIFFLLTGIPSVFINYFLLWKNDIYLTYFKLFEKEPKPELKKWAWISFITVILIIVLLVFSFYIMTSNMAPSIDLDKK
ncbi:MAG: hypothetical protein O9303_13290 [Silanimonas sp.]|nr:hypothetical protein [Silanimonas sp.]